MLLGVAVIAAVVVSIRAWWLRRTLRGVSGAPDASGGAGATAPGSQGTLIEGEYAVVPKSRRPGHD